MTAEGKLLWEPGPEWIAEANITAFKQWLKREQGLELTDYHHLWRWSVDNLEAFWQAVWDYFEIEASSPYTKVLGRRQMPGAEWFPGARLNYAQHILRQERVGANALYFASEEASLASVSWPQLANEVRVLATQLRALGIKPGDRIASYLPNIPQAIIAILATTSIGAIWSACSPDFGTSSVLDRFAQIEPKALICTDGYRYRGKAYERREELRRIIGQLASLQHIIFLPYLDKDNDTAPVSHALLWNDLLDHPPVPAAAFQFEQVPFEHPLWILYSSGTTGLPKAIVHGHGGILLEQMKLVTFHLNLRRGDPLFFFTTTGWMMWNFLVSSMLVGVTPVLYDGHPAYPEVDQLWKITAESGAKLFGASPTFVQIQEQAGVVPKQKFDLSALDSIMLAGSIVTAECMQWFYENVKEQLWLLPGSGGTDVCTGFVGGMPVLPVYAGEIQAPHLGVDAHAYDEDGNSVIDQVEELVIAQPMPSMPLYFWNDKNNERYRQTYFETYPGVWRQGDFFKINARDGCFVLGRSDATLNRFGIRIGTAEIYRVVEALK
ncbi:MAG: acetoacetate--CoA ligase, partial [Gammaproteobacteria bacterium]